MRTTIDRAGRVVVPKAIRERLQLTGGEVEIVERDGVVEIRPVADDIDVVETPEGPVASARRARPALTDVIVRETLEAVRH